MKNDVARSPPFSSLVNCLCNFFRIIKASFSMFTASRIFVFVFFTYFPRRQTTVVEVSSRVGILQFISARRRDDHYDVTHTAATGFAGISTDAALPLSKAASVLSRVSGKMDELGQEF